MFRFTIRDVLWLTAVAAVLIAWLLDRTPMLRELAIRRGAERSLEAHREAMKAELQAMKAELQAMKDRKPPIEQSRSSGGMFGRGPATLNEP